MTQEKIAYLAQIQGVINRLASASIACKGFTATIFAAVVAIILSSSDSNRALALAISLAPVVIFTFFDMYYFAKEIQYRQLYDAVLSDTHETDFDMCVGKVKSKVCLMAVQSISIWPFYLLFAIAYLGIFIALLSGLIS